MRLSETTKPTTEHPFPALIELPGKPVKPPTGFRPNSQAQYDYITATEPNLFMWGNRGGGKSVTARWTCHARALSYPNYRYAILRTSFPELEKNHLQYLGAEMEALGGNYNASKYIAKYPNGSIGLYMQCETDEQARNALGAELMEVVFDEAPTFKWDHMMMISASLRVRKDSGLTPLKRFNGNPTGTCIDELWSFFIDKDVDVKVIRKYNPSDWRAIEISMEDNTDLDVETYLDDLESLGLPEHLRKAWIEGKRFDSRTLFVVKPTIPVKKIDPETQTQIEVEQPYHIIEELPKAIDSNGKPTDILTLPWVRIQGCYDDGFIDPAVMLWAANVGSQIIVFNERVWQHTNSPDIAKEILNASVILKEDGTPYQLPLTTIYADPVIAKQTTAVQSTQEVMQTVWKCMEHGNVLKRCCAKARTLTFEPSTNSRELYASAINRLLQAEIAPNVPKLVFLKPNPQTDAGRNLIMRGIVGCPYLVKFLPKMQFDEKDTRKMADHKHDHPVVALAYLAMSYPIVSAPPVSSYRPAWMDEFFVKGTMIPKQQYRPRRR